MVEQLDQKEQALLMAHKTQVVEEEAMEVQLLQQEVLVVPV